MEQTNSPKLLEFRDLMTAIRVESASLQNKILLSETEKEGSEILNEFDNKIQTLAYSILTYLVDYQSYGWRALFD